MKTYKPFECVECIFGWLYMIYEVTPEGELMVKQIAPKVPPHEPFLLKKDRIEK